MCKIDVKDIIKDIIYIVFMVVVGYMIGKYTNEEKHPITTINDSIQYNIKIIDSIQYNIIQRDSIIKQIKNYKEDEIKEAISADDSTTIDMFYKLLSE